MSGVEEERGRRWPASEVKYTMVDDAKRVGKRGKGRSGFGGVVVRITSVVRRRRHGRGCGKQEKKTVVLTALCGVKCALYVSGRAVKEFRMWG